MGLDLASPCPLAEGSHFDGLWVGYRQSLPGAARRDWRGHPFFKCLPIMKLIALTGGIACGKSALASFLSAGGCEVFDTDVVTHALEAPGGHAVAPIVAAFGPVVRAPDGSIDRLRLGEAVFQDEGARRRLNGIVHPLIRAELDEWLQQPGERPKVAVIPLLFEVGWDTGWDAIVCVACAAAEQLRRLQTRGLSAAAAQARVVAQMALDEKVRRSTHVVWNDGDREALRSAADRLIDEWSGNKR
jgi:dephospho-CoA kinase